MLETAPARLPLRILKQKTDCAKAAVLAGWLLGAFDAIEKKYLKELMLVVYLDPATPDTVHEMYTFKFSYPGGLATCEVQGRDGSAAKAAQADMYRSTQNLLQTVVVLTQSLGPLPDSAYLALKLTYYDEVTPADYEPNGFCATELTELQLPSGVQRQKTEKVTTDHHTVRLNVFAVPREIVGDNMETSTVVNDDCLFSQSQTESQGKHAGTGTHPSSQLGLGSQDSIVSLANQLGVREGQMGDKVGQMEDKVGQIGDEVGQMGDHVGQIGDQAGQSQSSNLSQPQNQDMEAESASLLDRSLSVSCTCGNKHPDLLMLVCSFCSRAQHAACYRILEEAKLPAHHCCVQCSQEEEGRVCTDPKLVKMSTKPAVTVTCMYRRILAVLTVTEQVSLNSVAESLGISEQFAEKVVEKLEKENILRPFGGGQFRVDNQVLLQQALPKYLGIRPDVDSIVRQTGDLKISGGRRKHRLEDSPRQGTEGEAKRRKASASLSNISVTLPK
jgi:hypothetical protein